MKRYHHFNIYTYAEVLYLATDKDEKGLTFLGRRFELEMNSETTYEVPSEEGQCGSILREDGVLIVMSGGWPMQGTAERPVEHRVTRFTTPLVREGLDLLPGIREYIDYLKNNTSTPLLDESAITSIKDSRRRRRLVYSPPADMIRGTIFDANLSEDGTEVSVDLVMYPALRDSLRHVGSMLISKHGVVRVLPIELLTYAKTIDIVGFGICVANPLLGEEKIIPDAVPTEVDNAEKPE